MARTLDLVALILLVFLLLKKVLSASSYGHFTAAKEFWSQCHIFRGYYSKNCMRPWIRSVSNIIQKKPCATPFWLKILFCLPKRLLRHDCLNFEISKNMFPGIFPSFDICNPKLFASNNRSSIVPSPQNINLI